MTAKLHPIKHDLKTVLWCGPGALAILTGQPTSIIREACRKATGRELVKGIHVGPLVRAAADLGLKLTTIQSFSHKQTLARPTLAAYIKQHRRFIATRRLIVLVGNHYVVLSGRSFCDNWTKTPVPFGKAPKRRRRVELVLLVEDLALKPVLPVVPAKPKDVHRVARQEAKRLAREYDIEIEPHNPGEFWVYPPGSLYLTEEADPYHDDHCAFDGWPDVLKRCRAYAAERIEQRRGAERVAGRFLTQIPAVSARVSAPTEAPKNDVPPGALAASLGLKYGHHYTDGEEIVGVFTKDCSVSSHGVEVVVSIQEGFGPIKEKISLVKVREVE